LSSLSFDHSGGSVAQALTSPFSTFSLLCLVLMRVKAENVNSHISRSKRPKVMQCTFSQLNDLSVCAIFSPWSEDKSIRFACDLAGSVLLSFPLYGFLTQSRLCLNIRELVEIIVKLDRSTFISGTKIGIKRGKHPHISPPIV
jgi:hypothetical protein